MKLLSLFLENWERWEHWGLGMGVETVPPALSNPSLSVWERERKKTTRARQVALGPDRVEDRLPPWSRLVEVHKVGQVVLSHFAGFPTLRVDFGRGVRRFVSHFVGIHIYLGINIFLAIFTLQDLPLYRTSHFVDCYYFWSG